MRKSVLSGRTSSQRQLFSTSDKPKIKKNFFGYTAPLPGDASDKRRQEASKYSNEISYITKTTSRFSLEKPEVYLKNATPGIFCAHIENEIEIQKNRIKTIKNSDSYMKYMELCIKREVLANELLRLEQINASLVNESNRAAQKFAKIVSDTAAQKHTLDLREASNYKEEYERLLDLYLTQSNAIKERKKRQILCEITEEKANKISQEIEHFIGKTQLVKMKHENKIKNDEKFKTELINARESILDKLIEYYNENDQDLEVPMADVVKYVHNEDPVIQLRNFKKYKHCLEEKKLNDLADSSFAKEPQEKNIFKWE